MKTTEKDNVRNEIAAILAGDHNGERPKLAEAKQHLSLRFAEISRDRIDAHRNDDGTIQSTDFRGITTEMAQWGSKIGQDFHLGMDYDFFLSLLNRVTSIRVEIHLDRIAGPGGGT